MELSPEHQRIRDEARERIKRLMGRLITDPNHIPGEPCDEGAESKNT